MYEAVDTFGAEKALVNDTKEGTMASIEARNANHPEYSEPSYTELEDRVAGHLKNREMSQELFPKPGSVRWYVKAVQLDLEARGIIERVPAKSPIELRKV